MCYLNILWKLAGITSGFGIPILLWLALKKHSEHLKKLDRIHHNERVPRVRKLRDDVINFYISAPLFKFNDANTEERKLLELDHGKSEKEKLLELVHAEIGIDYYGKLSVIETAFEMDYIELDTQEFHETWGCYEDFKLIYDSIEFRITEIFKELCTYK